MTTMTESQPGLDVGSFEYVRQLLHSRSAIVLEPTKGYLVESRLSPIANQLGLSGIRDLVGKLRQQPHGELHERVVDAMTTNETSFFRDVHPFESLCSQIIPELVARRQQRRALHIWSAACSTGQEPFTLAMLLRESFPQLAGWEVKIHATDLSRAVLERAAAATYTQAEVNRGLPSRLLVKYFERRGANWVVKPEVRGLVTFRHLNLNERWTGLPTMDVILLRNVLIYFNPDTKSQILAKVHRQMTPDGALLLGGAESTMGLSTDFERVVLGKTMVYRPTDWRQAPAAIG